MRNGVRSGPFVRDSSRERKGPFDWGAYDAMIAIRSFLLAVALAVASPAHAAPDDPDPHLPYSSSVGPVVPEVSRPYADTTASRSAAADTSVRPVARDSVLLLPEIRVETARVVPRPRHFQPTAFVSDLAAREPGRTFGSIGETLAQAAGIRVLQYGGLGAFSTVSVRGAPAAHTAVLVDGEPIQSAAHSVTSLSDVPAAAVERIEVYRGSSLLAWGMPAPAGAVNLVTLPSARGLDARIVRGSFDTWEGVARGSAVVGPLVLALNTGYQGSRGDYRYFDDNGTPFETGDDSTTTRINNRFGAAHAFGGLTWNARRDLIVRVREDWFRKTQGLPGLASVQAKTAERSIERSISRVDVERPARGAWPLARVRGAARRERGQFRDTAGELGLGRWRTDDRFAGERAGLDLEWPALPLGLSVRGTADAGTERARTTNSADAYADPPTSRRDARGAALALRLTAPGGRAMLHAARRWDRIRDELRGLATAGLARRIDVTRETSAPQLGASVRPFRALELRGNWTDAERVPDFTELFGDGGGVYGNLLLHPERTRMWDAGAVLSWRIGVCDGHAQWAHFETRSENLIHYFPASNGVKALNLERARTRGNEFELLVGPVKGFRITAAHTRQSGEDRSTVGYWSGKQLPLLPASQLDARITWAGARYGGYVDAFHLGANFLDRSNRTRIASRALVGAGIWLQLQGALRASLEGRNLGDQRATDVAGYPLPGRTLFVALESSVPFPDF